MQPNNLEATPPSKTPELTLPTGPNRYEKLTDEHLELAEKLLRRARLVKEPFESNVAYEQMKEELEKFTPRESLDERVSSLVGYVQEMEKKYGKEYWLHPLHEMGKPGALAMPLVRQYVYIVLQRVLEPKKTNIVNRTLARIKAAFN